MKKILASLVFLFCAVTGSFATSSATGDFVLLNAQSITAFGSIGLVTGRLYTASLTVTNVSNLTNKTVTINGITFYWSNVTSGVRLIPIATNSTAQAATNFFGAVTNVSAGNLLYPAYLNILSESIASNTVKIIVSNGYSLSFSNDYIGWASLSVVTNIGGSVSLGGSSSAYATDAGHSTNADKLASGATVTNLVETNTTLVGNTGVRGVISNADTTPITYKGNFELTNNINFQQVLGAGNIAGTGIVMSAKNSTNSFGLEFVDGNLDTNILRLVNNRLSVSLTSLGNLSALILSSDTNNFDAAGAAASATNGLYRFPGALLPPGTYSVSQWRKTSGSYTTGGLDENLIGGWTSNGRDIMTWGGSPPLQDTNVAPIMTDAAVMFHTNSAGQFFYATCSLSNGTAGTTIVPLMRSTYIGGFSNICFINFSNQPNLSISISPWIGHNQTNLTSVIASTATNNLLDTFYPYECHPTDGSMTNWSVAVPVVGDVTNQACHDVCILPNDNGTNWWVDAVSGPGNIRLLYNVGTNFLSGWTLVTNIVGGITVSENPSLVKRGPNWYQLHWSPQAYTGDQVADINGNLMGFSSSNMMGAASTVSSYPTFAAGKFYTVNYASESNAIMQSLFAANVPPSPVAGDVATNNGVVAFQSATIGSGNSGTLQTSGPFSMNGGFKWLLSPVQSGMITSPFVMPAAPTTNSFFAVDTSAMFSNLQLNLPTTLGTVVGFVLTNQPNATNCFTVVMGAGSGRFADGSTSQILSNKGEVIVCGLASGATASKVYWYWKNTADVLLRNGIPANSITGTNTAASSSITNYAAGFGTFSNGFNSTFYVSGVCTSVAAGAGGILVSNLTMGFGFTLSSGNIANTEPVCGSILANPNDQIMISNTISGALSGANVTKIDAVLRLR